MITLLGKRKYGPIGVDLGSRSVKLIQFDAKAERIIESARWDLSDPASGDTDERCEQLVRAVRQAREGRSFRGRDAVFCVGAPDLFLQNIRVSPGVGEELDRAVCGEAAARLNFPPDEAEIRYLEAAEVRQADQLRREVILMACRRSVLDRVVAVAEGAGLRLRAIDVETVAILRCYGKQFRRDADRQEPMMLVNLGASRTAVVVAQGADPILMKYLDTSGSQLDQAAARYLQMSLADAAALRRHHGDRRADQRDPTISRSIADAVRPVLERLFQELSMCVRYYSVTFRGRPLRRIVLSGGEADQSLAEALAQRLDLPCELGDPLRSFQPQSVAGRRTQWDVAAGLALRCLN